MNCYHSPGGDGWKAYWDLGEVDFSTSMHSAEGHATHEARGPSNHSDTWTQLG